MISVIIPTLNEEKIIGKMLSQFSNELIEKYDLELILSDGGSTDLTVEIAQQQVHAALGQTSNRKE
ncbi:MAG: glycosyltransferase, partial [Bacteroidota bacterium]